MPLKHSVHLRLAVPYLVVTLLAACAVARTHEELVAAASPTPGSATLRSLAEETGCRLLEVPADLPDVAALVDTAVLQRTFADTVHRDFGLTFNRQGDLEEVRYLRANALGMDERREAIDRFYPAVHAQQPRAEWSARVVRDTAGTWRMERSVFCPAQLVLRDRYGTIRRYGVHLRGEVHVTVTADGSPDAVYMPQVRARGDEVGNRVTASGLRFIAATLNGEPVQSVVIFGRERRGRLRR